MSGHWALSWDAVAALATATTVLAIGLAWRAESHRRRMAEEQRRGQAAHVSAWVEVAEDGRSAVLVANNASAEPIWQPGILAGWIDESGKFNGVGETEVRPTLGAHATLRRANTADRLLEAYGEGRLLACQLTFRDAGGRTWTRDHDGMLTEGRKVG